MILLLIYGATAGPFPYLYIMEILRPKLLDEVMIFSWVLQLVMRSVSIGIVTQPGLSVYDAMLPWNLLITHVYFIWCCCYKKWVIETDNKHPVEIRLELMESR